MRETRGEMRETRRSTFFFDFQTSDSETRKEDNAPIKTRRKEDVRDGGDGEGGKGGTSSIIAKHSHPCCGKGKGGSIR